MPETGIGFFPDVDRAFGAPSLGEIDKRLRHVDTPWAAAASTALEITHALSAGSRQRTLSECPDAELALTRTTIRAALVDKDRTPRRHGASLGGRTPPA
ncbi:hypothetical protein [Streptomyces acidiscabies]